MITCEPRDGVTVVRLEHGKVNALDIELLDAIRSTFAELHGPVVFTGTGRAFSAGVDLNRVIDGGADYVHRFLPVLSGAARAVLDHPAPVVAAVNGHAIAGGCILAAACDRRLMSAGRIGVTELLVGVPFPAAPLEILRHAVGDAVATDLILTGATHQPEAALARGLVHEVVAPERLADRAVEVAEELAAIPAETYALTKRQLRREATARMDAAPDDAQVAAIWASQETAAGIRAFLDRTIGRG